MAQQSTPKHLVVAASPSPSPCSPSPTAYRRPTAPSAILKSGVLWKKGVSILGQQYKRRLFELKLNGELDYFEVFDDDIKVLKGTIILSASSTVEVRATEESKFIIKTHDREWYLWSRPSDPEEDGDEVMKEWCDVIGRMISSSKSRGSLSELPSNQKLTITTNPVSDCVVDVDTDADGVELQSVRRHQRSQTPKITPSEPTLSVPQITRSRAITVNVTRSSGSDSVGSAESRGSGIGTEVVDPPSIESVHSIPSTSSGSVRSTRSRTTSSSGRGSDGPSSHRRHHGSDDLTIDLMTPQIPEIGSPASSVGDDPGAFPPTLSLIVDPKEEEKVVDVVDDKMAKRARRRQRAIEELVSTEKTYVDLLSKLVEHFVKRLKDDDSMLSAEEYQVLFPAVIHPILGLNLIFLQDLITVIESETFNNDSTGIGKIIDEFCPHFKMYQNYCNNYNAANQRLAELRKKTSSAFSKYCDEQTKSPVFNNLPIESLLILPIQRMPRYKMLLEEIIKHTEADHPDLDQLQTALTKICSVNNSINSDLKDFQSRFQVQILEHRFKGKVTNLMTPSRRVIREGVLKKNVFQDGQYKPFLFVLFNDSLLYAAESMSSNKLTFGNLLPFNGQFGVQLPSKIMVPNMFEVHSSNESFMVFSESKQERDEWMECIAAAYRAYSELQTVQIMSKSRKKGKKDKVATLFIPFDLAEKCMVKRCGTKFSFRIRKNHCKECGFVVCSKCCANDIKVCDDCRFKRVEPEPDLNRSKTTRPSVGESLRQKLTGLGISDTESDIGSDGRRRRKHRRSMSAQNLLEIKKKEGGRKKESEIAGLKRENKKFKKRVKLLERKNLALEAMLKVTQQELIAKDKEIEALIAKHMGQRERTGTENVVSSKQTPMETAQ